MADRTIPENLDENFPSESAQSRNMQNHQETTLTEKNKMSSEMSATDTGGNDRTSLQKHTEVPETDIHIMRNVLPELCEFEPLNFLLDQLPRKAQRAMVSPFPIEFTCLDVSKDFIVLGANFPMVFIYNRRENTITKLRCEDRSCHVKCVKLQTSIDHQVAVGTSSGQVEIYLLPTDRPGQIFKEVRRFLVDGAHRHSVTCAEWSANGMKLFTGDSVGQVAYSDIDFYENKCRTDIIHVEDMPIVQLNYAHRILIISTYNRAVLCYTDEQYRLQQVGQQPRKIKGQFGCHFVPGLCKARDATLCTTRPGLRIWHANTDGTVQETFKFKELLSAQHQTIMLLPSTRQAMRDTSDLQFGPVLFFNDCYMLTWSHNMLAVLDVKAPGGARVVASSLGDLGNIIAVATCGEEVYILRRGGDRPLIRVATAPEVFQLKEKSALTEAEQLKASSGNDAHQPKALSSPSTSRKTTFKNSLSTMKSLFHKAKEEIVDTTAKLMVTKLGKQDLDECKSAGSSRRSSQEGILTSGGTPDATISPAILVGRLAATEEVDKERVSHSNRNPPEQTESPAQAETQIASSEEPTAIFTAPPPDAADNHVAIGEPPTVTLNEEKLLKIGQESFDDIIFRPEKQSKRKKKASKGSKKESAERSSTPSPTHSPSLRRSKSPSGSDRNRTGSTKSDSLTVKSSSSEMESHSMKPGSISNQEKDKRSESINSFKSEESRSLRSDSNQSFTEMHRSRGSEGQETLVPKNEQSNHVKTENESIGTAPTKIFGDQDYADGGKTVNATECTKSSDIPIGDVVLGGMIASSLDDVATRIGTPFSDASLNPSIREFPGTLRSWDDPTGLGTSAEPHVLAGRIHMQSTDSIHTLRSGADNLKLDLEVIVPEASQQPAHFPDTEQLNEAHLPVEANEVSPKLGEIKMDSTDDEIYTKYFAETPSSPPSSPPAVFVPEEPENRVGPNQELEPEDLEEGEQVEDAPIPENIQQQFAGSWMQCSTPGYIMQLVVSDKHVWCVDNRDKVYHSLVSNVTMKWNKLKDHAMQMATSPSGNIVWRLHRKSGTAYACAPISPLSPIGTKWYPASKGATHICLDENIAWIIKSNGEIFVHKDISRDRPLTKEDHVDSNAYVLQIAANRGVVWAIGSNRKVLYRSEVGRTRPEGKKWLGLEEDESTKLRFVSIALDSRNVGWGIDEDGLVWFRTGVTVNTPMGDDKKWWQVPMGEYLMQDPNALKMLLNMAGTNATVDRMTSWLKKQYYRATYIAASVASVWVCGSSHYKSSLQVSKGNLLGSRWENGCPVGLPTSAAWVSVSATGVYGPSGMIWAALKSGEVFCFPPYTRKPQQVDPPMAGVIFRHLSATSGTMWALQEDGNIFVRKQITARCPQGLSWKKLILDQLGPSKIVHFSCGDEVVWACDNEGMIYLRIGVDIAHDEFLPPAWLPVDGRASGYGTYFAYVFCSVDNRLVWALDNKKTVYVRKGICTELPVGLEWEVVEGTHAIHLCISTNTVWALCPNGDVACRFGITDKNCVGDYWKKVPGSYTYLSVTQSDDLWAINNEGILYQRFTKMFHGRGTPHVEQLGSPIKGEDDWELL